MALNYVEYSASKGPGTLVKHGVFRTVEPVTPANAEYDDCHRFPGVLFQNYEIDAAHYQEFIQIHGSERAV